MPKMEKQEKIKLQINVSVELCERIDALAKEIGMDRSQLCAYYIGKQVKQEELQSNALSSIMSQFSPALVEAFKGMLPEIQAVEDNIELGELETLQELK